MVGEDSTAGGAGARRGESLWRNGDFVRLWVAETASLAGSQVTLLALPLVAVITLDATAGELGLLNAARFAPFIAMTLVAGAIVDRVRRRPILIRTNIGRAALLALVPLAAALDILRIEHLYAVGFLVGVLTVFFDVAYLSYLPSLVPRAHLTDANSKLQTSASVAEVGGPGVGGMLVQVLTAPLALLVDVVSFLFSALLVSQIRVEEPRPAVEPTRTLASIREGFAFTFGNRYLRAVAGEAATFNLFEQALMTAFFVYAVRELELSPGALGLMLSIGAAGAIAGSVGAALSARALGFGRAVVVSMGVACAAPLAIPFVDGDVGRVVALLGAVFFVWNTGVAVSNVLVVTLRQAITPDAMLGRMNASYRFFTYGAIPLGALLGGGLAETVGLQTTLLVAAAGHLLAFAWIVASPLGDLHEVPRALAREGDPRPS